MITSQSESLFTRAQKTIPGGVNSPVRAFRSVGGKPLFIRRAWEAWLEDEDGNRYLDFINSWGPMILGHANPMIEEAIREALPASFSFGAPTVKEIEMALNTPNYTFLWIHFVKIENGNKKTPLFALKNYYLIDSNLIKSPGLFTFLLSKSNNV